jgi:hypothetical protein
MAKPELNPLNLGSIARGAAIELFEDGLAKVVANIADKATDATASREIVLRFKFKPDDDRRACVVATTLTTKLAGHEEHVSKIYLGKDEHGKSYAFESDPRQEILFEPPAEEDNLVDFNDSRKKIN